MVKISFKNSSGSFDLQKMADEADTLPRLSDKEAEQFAWAWHNEQDENALERLLIDKSRLIIMRLSKYMRAFRDVPKDVIREQAIEGAKKSIISYLSKDQKDASLNHYIAQGAVWNVLDHNKNREGRITEHISEGREALRAAEQTKGKKLTTAEEQEVLGEISSNLATIYYGKKFAGTIAMSQLTSLDNLQHPQKDSEHSLATHTEDLSDWIIDPNSAEPSEILEMEELEELVQMVIEHLPDQHRDAYELRSYLNLNFDEIGEILEVSGTTARNYYNKTLKKIKAEINKINIQLNDPPQHKLATLRQEYEDNLPLTMSEIMEFHTLCKENQLAKIDGLLQKDKRYAEMRDALGNTPLITAARNGKIRVIERLIDSGVDINAINKNGDTALMVAAKEGQGGSVRTLLTLGADPTITNKNGKDALALSKEFGIGWIVNEITEHQKESEEFQRNLKPTSQDTDYSIEPL